MCSPETRNMQAAIEHMARHAPLDLMKPREVQAQLKAIAGEPHAHRNSISSPLCDWCLRYADDAVHAGFAA